MYRSTNYSQVLNTFKCYVTLNWTRSECFYYPLSPNIDRHQISPCNINAQLSAQVSRIKEMITGDELLIFEQLLPTSTTTNVWQQVRRIDMLTLGCKGLKCLLSNQKVIHKSGIWVACASGRLWELFMTEFKWRFKWGFTMLAVTRTGRLQEWSLGELQRYMYNWVLIFLREGLLVAGYSVDIVPCLSVIWVIPVIRICLSWLYQWPNIDFVRVFYTREEGEQQQGPWGFSCL